MLGRIQRQELQETGQAIKSRDLKEKDARGLTSNLQKNGDQRKETKE